MSEAQENSSSVPPPAVEEAIDRIERASEAVGAEAANVNSTVDTRDWTRRQQTIARQALIAAVRHTSEQEIARLKAEVAELTTIAMILILAAVPERSLLEQTENKQP